MLALAREPRQPLQQKSEAQMGASYTQLVRGLLGPHESHTKNQQALKTVTSADTLAWEERDRHKTKGRLWGLQGSL